MLTGKDSRISKISTGFQQVVQNFDSVFGIAANAEVINKEESDPGIVFQFLGILRQIVTVK